MTKQVKMKSTRPNAVCIAWSQFADYFWGTEERSQLLELVNLYPVTLTASDLLDDEELMGTIDFIFGAWGMPKLDAKTLARMPRLKGVFYAGGSVRTFATEAFWESGIKLSNSTAVNAIPVAEYCLATILFSLKGGFRHALKIRGSSAWHGRNEIIMPGAYKSQVGLISLGAIGRKTLELLKPFELEITVYSTSLTQEEADRIGVRKTSIEEIYATCDVVSLHTALLPETEGMIRGTHFRLMKAGATFINTARGAVVNQPEMVEVLRERPEIFAVLDVVDPEPPLPGDPLFELPNVIMTPHISGSMQNECRRLGQNTIDEFKRFLEGQPLLWEVQHQAFSRTA